MYSRIVASVVLMLPLAMGAGAFAGSPAPETSPTEKTECQLNAGAGRTPHEAAGIKAAAAVSVDPTASSHTPKVVFQINQAADAPSIIRFVTNYLIAEPAARVVVVGYGGGVDFMLKGALDSAGKPFADQVKSLADKGVLFKVCNNTLKARNLSADAVVPGAIEVPGAVNEIIRLQTREGYAYFRH